MNKILVVQTSFLGDVVLSTPLFRAVRLLYPKAHVALLCSPQAALLLEDSKELDEIIPDNKKQKRGLRGILDKAQELRAKEFTLAISPHKSFRTALLLYLAKIPLRVGFRQSAGWFFFNRRTDRRASLHDVERNLGILFGLNADPYDFDRALHLDVTSEKEKKVRDKLSALGVEKKPDTLIFGLNPGSVWPTKRWSVEGFAEVAVKLKEKYRCEILLFGAREDADIVERIQNLSGVGISLAGKIGLEELTAAIDHCDLFITNDSGPMHVAVAREVPVVAIFCATTPSLGFYPYSSEAIVLEKNLHCRPCSTHGGLRCPLGTEDCIREIQPEHVIHAAASLLQAVRLEGQCDDPYRPRFIAC